MVEYHQKSNHLEAWMSNAFNACVDAQLVINNPFWDIQTKKPIQGEVADYVVEFTRVPKVSVYHVNINLTNTYPGALSLSCRLDSKTHMVLQAAYHQGEQSKEVDLVEHEPLAGIEENELDSLVRNREIQGVPLYEFYEITILEHP
jgi:hypothetical protein